MSTVPPPQVRRLPEYPRERIIDENERAGTLIDAEVDRELLYVGLSRGKSRLYLASVESACTAAVTLP